MNLRDKLLEEEKLIEKILTNSKDLEEIHYTLGRQYTVQKILKYIENEK